MPTLKKNPFRNSLAKEHLIGITYFTVSSKVKIKPYQLFRK
jgi:hypothetical protein